MKLSHFALSAIFLLLGVAVYLTIRSDLDNRLEEQNLTINKLTEKIGELDKKLSSPPVVATPAPVAAQADVEKPAPRKAPAAPRDPAALEALAAAAAIPADENLMVPENDPRMQESERDLLEAATAADPGLPSPGVRSSPPVLPGGVAEAPSPRAPVPAAQRRIGALPAIARVKQFAEKEAMVGLDNGSNANLRPGGEFALRRKSEIVGRVRISETITDTECAADVISMAEGKVPAVNDEVIQFDE